MKRCSGPCGQIKPLEDFSPHPSTTDGYRHACKACFAVVPRAERAETAEEKRERQLARIRERHENDSEYRDRLAVNRRKSTYGITAEQYDGLVASQGGKCAICKTVPKYFDIDHDHKCCPGRRSCGACIRGLLCRPCNIMLSNGREDPIIFAAATGYLAQHPTPEVKGNRPGPRRAVAEHGTVSGYQRHRRERDTEDCEPCKEAWRIYTAERRAQRVVAARLGTPTGDPVREQ